jgi:hypothetical protein
MGPTLLDRASPKTIGAAFALAKLVLHTLWLTPYGFFRDELYYIACSEHLAFGYVDQPPWCVFTLRVWRTIVGDSLAALRMLPALIGAASVWVTALLVVRLGGGRLAVALALLAIIVDGQHLGTAHYYSMNVWDDLFWPLAALLAVVLLEHRRARDWIALGVVLGIGLENKTSVLWLCAGLVAGIAATPERMVLRTRGPYIAAAIAAALFAPYVAWEIAHGWPTLEFMRNAMGEKYVARSFGAFVVEQVMQNDPFCVPLWVAGIVALVSRRLGSRAAVIGWIYVTTFAIVASQKTAKAEYLSPCYPMLFAAGATWLERALASRIVVRAALAGTLAIAMLVGGAMSAPFALACLSEERFVAYQAALGMKPESTERRELAELPQFYADMHGWRELTDFVADIYDALSPEERAHATIWTRQGGYGSAAAIDFFGRARKLPRAICGHNNYWYWGPGDGDGSVVIVVGGKPDRMVPLFESFERVATFECRWCRPDENHKPIYVGRKIKRALAEVWPGQRYFD